MSCNPEHKVIPGANDVAKALDWTTGYSSQNAIDKFVGRVIACIGDPDPDRLHHPLVEDFGVRAAVTGETRASAESLFKIASETGFLTAQAYADSEPLVGGVTSHAEITALDALRVAVARAVLAVVETYDALAEEWVHLPEHRLSFEEDPDGF